MSSRFMLLLIVVSACSGSSGDDDSGDDLTSARSDQEARRTENDGTEIDASSCVGTWDIGTLGDAQAILSPDDRICIQAVDRNGTPTIFAVIEDAARCTCPEPYLLEATVRQ